MSPRTGRPKSDNPKNIRLEIRLDKKTHNDLQECADKLNISKTEVVLKGIEIVKKSLDKK